MVKLDSGGGGGGGAIHSAKIPEILGPKLNGWFGPCGISPVKVVHL